MPKILILTRNLSSGGAERQMINVACLLKDRGLEVEFLCYNQGDFYSYLLSENQIPVHWKIERNPISRFLSIRKFIRSRKYDSVVSFLEMPNLYNCLSAIGGRSWTVVTGERSAKDRTFRSSKGRFFAWFRRYADYIICNSENAKALWEAYYPAYREKLRIIYNCVLLPVPTSKYVPKRDGKIHIVIPASYQYLKNPIGVIEALSLLNESQRDSIFVNWYGRKEIIESDDEAYRKSMMLIQKYNLEGIIYLNGATTDIVNKLNVADFVGLFSSVEGLPNAICEGMTLGKPIIMTKVSDYKSLVDGTNGFLCDWDDIESIKEAFIRAIELSVTEIEKMGSSSKNKANKLFLKDRITEEWIDLMT